MTLSIDQISIGGNMFEVDDDQDDNTKTDSSFGIGWSEGPLGLGVQYGSRDGGFEVTAVNAAYALGPGIAVNSQVRRQARPAIREFHAWMRHEFTEFLLGTAIFF